VVLRNGSYTVKQFDRDLGGDLPSRPEKMMCRLIIASKILLCSIYGDGRPRMVGKWSRNVEIMLS
jgi:hypothetical protein